jgi:tetratricopeptide (TPR) repeat protein
MSERKLKFVIAFIIFALVLSVYVYSAAPTASFWDCSELIAVSYILGIPHPPGTPLFVMLGRIFSLFPIAKEIAFRVGFLTAFFGAISSALVYLLVLKLLSMFKTKGVRQRFPFIAHIAGVVAALAIAFAYSFWDNCVEAEVYTPCVAVALAVLYMALLWRNEIEKGFGDNRMVLAAIYILFLSTGIHFTPVMVLFALLFFGLVVDKKAILDLRLIELIVLYLIFAAISGLGLVDYMVLFLASPTVAIIKLLESKFIFFLIFVAIYLGYLYYLYSRKQLDAKYVGLGILLIGIASTVQFYLMVRARLEPMINEVNPSRWNDFVSVLKREQYDPMKLYPRKTMFLTEEDYRNYPNSYPAFSLFQGYFEQIKFYVRYFLWQWAGEQNLDIFYRIRLPALFGIIPPILGVWGMWHQYKNDRKSFVLTGLCFLIASLGLITYLNLKYSPSDPRPMLKFREVRERDYFFAFSFVFFSIFVGIGVDALLNWLLPKLKFRKLATVGVSLVLVLLMILPLFFNYRNVTRRYNWIPAEYGYNMLISCEGEKAVLFTNGDNDTFPLWFMQAVPSRISDYKPGFGSNVAVANLSLLNTSWYCKQLKRWGAPISFSEAEIDRLPQGFAGKRGRTFLLKDIMIRDIVATAGGVKLKWPDDYASTAQEFMAKVFANYQPKSNVYFATTVSRDNLIDVEPYLRLQGLVNLVVPDSGTNQVDVAKTEYLVEKVYKMESMLDKRVMKDENTRGLFINYAATAIALAQEYQKRGNLAKAAATIKKALEFDIEPMRKAALFFHASVYDLMLGNYQEALAYLDSIEKSGVRDVEISLRRGWAYQQLGEYEKAERALREAMAVAPNRPEPVQSLYTLYLDRMHDTAKAKGVLTDWLRRNPGDSMAQKMLKNLE